MSAESMLYYGAILSFTVVLVGVAWGFVLLKVSGESAEAE